MSLLNNSTLANDETAYYAVAGSQIPIPGPTGAAGPTGPLGATGPSGNSILSGVNPPTAGQGAVDDLYVDLFTTQLFKKTDAITWSPEFALKGEQGNAATIAVGSTSTLPPGSNAGVANGGSSSAAIFNFAIPRGDVGPTGPAGSAAEAALWSTYPATQTVDMCGNDLNEMGSLTTSGLFNTVDFGSVIPPSAPLARFTVLSSEIVMNHVDPVSQMLIRGQGDVRVESTNGDLNLIGDDVNIAATGSTNVLNITAAGAIQQTSGGAINNSVGGAFGVQAGGLISLLTTGSIQIGSGNVLGAKTSIEKLNIDDSEITKLGDASDLSFKNTKLIQNSGNPLNRLHLEAVDANTELYGRGVVIRSTGAPGGITYTGDIQFNMNGVTPLVFTWPSAVPTFNTNMPKCAVVPAAVDDLTNKAYVDTKLPADANIDLSFNLAAPAASAATNGPFIYVPSAVGPPTGTPAAVAGATPLFFETGGSGKLWAYFGGLWNPI